MNLHEVEAFAKLVLNLTVTLNDLKEKIKTLEDERASILEDNDALRIECKMLNDRVNELYNKSWKPDWWYPHPSERLKEPYAHPQRGDIWYSHTITSSPKDK